MLIARHLICIRSQLPWDDFILENGVSEKTVSSSALFRNELRLGFRASFKETACSTVMPVRERHQTSKAVLLRLKHLRSCESTGPMHRVWGRASDSAFPTSSRGADAAGLQTTLKSRNDVFAKQTLPACARTRHSSARRLQRKLWAF